MSYQLFIGMGRIAHEPEFKANANGTTVTTFTVPIDRPYTKDGEKITDWFDCFAYGQTADFIAKYFHKGDMIHIQGAVQKRKYTNKNGVDVNITEIKVDRADFCGSKKETANIDITVDDTPKHTLTGVTETELKEIPTEDDLPF